MPTPIVRDEKTLPTVALIGRVNVGKSTLFNRLIESKKAIVSDIAGTTRTNNEGIVHWRGKMFRIVDTGGLTFAQDIPLEDEIIEQTKRAIKEADILIMVTDAKTGILPQEKEVAKLVRRKDKPVFLLLNKADTKKLAMQYADKEWMQLGLGPAIPISASNGRGIGDFLDTLYSKLHTISIRPKLYKEPKDQIRISLIGKPNVGKSSLFNKLIGENRVIVNDMAHTTREPYDTDVTYTYDTETQKNIAQRMTFVDTAGIRRKAKVEGDLERQGIHKSLKSIDQSDVILFVIDATDPISTQDKQLGGLIEQRSKSVIVLINKWDLAEKNSETDRKEFLNLIRYTFPHLNFAPVLFVSGLSGYRIHQIFPTIMQAWRARHTMIPPTALRIFLDEITKKKLPARGKGTRHPKILRLKQIGQNPPIFELVIKYRTSLHRSYLNYIENRLRERFDFFATPIVIKLSKSKLS